MFTRPLRDMPQPASVLPAGGAYCFLCFILELGSPPSHWCQEANRGRAAPPPQQHLRRRTSAPPATAWGQLPETHCASGTRGILGRRQSGNPEQEPARFCARAASINPKPISVSKAFPTNLRFVQRVRWAAAPQRTQACADHKALLLASAALTRPPTLHRVPVRPPAPASRAWRQHLATVPAHLIAPLNCPCAPPDAEQQRGWCCVVCCQRTSRPPPGA